MPSDYAEAVTLVPSLKTLDQEKVSKMVAYLNEKRGYGHGHIGMWLVINQSKIYI